MGLCYLLCFKERERVFSLHLSFSADEIVIEGSTVHLKANEVWGAMYALETVLQLLHKDSHNQVRHTHPWPKQPSSLF